MATNKEIALKLFVDTPIQASWQDKFFIPWGEFEFRVSSEAFKCYQSFNAIAQAKNTEGLEDKDRDVLHQLLADPHLRTSFALKKPLILSPSHDESTG
jgi:hypothetical protein